MHECRYGNCISIISWKELMIFVIYCLWNIFFNLLLLQLSDYLLQARVFEQCWRPCLCRLSDTQEAETRWTGGGPVTWFGLQCQFPVFPDLVTWCKQLPFTPAFPEWANSAIILAVIWWTVPSQTLNQTNPASPKLLLPRFDHGDMEKSVLKNRVTAMANLITWLASLLERLAVGLGKHLERRLEK